MGLERIKNKIKDLGPQNSLEQELMLQEMMQKYVLVALAKSHFFTLAEFHGGTFLRIMHNLERFSEDLDFVLKTPNHEFSWEPFYKTLDEVFKSDDIGIEIIDRSKADNAVKKAFLKTDSLGKLLVVDLPFARNRNQKIKIKLEIDANPPSHSTFESQFLDFPSPVTITTQTLASSFSGKIHALLCRNYVKGRDWYDFIWYVEKRLQPNYKLLKSALFQNGPWKEEVLDINSTFLLSALKQKIAQVDWEVAKSDVHRFLKQKDREQLEVWGADYFNHVLKNLQTALG
jgi:predicted nucleotidyltransferase component of viral defense system